MWEVGKGPRRGFLQGLVGDGRGQRVMSGVLEDWERRGGV